MSGIVVLFEAERLPIERAIEVGQLASAPRDLGFMFLPAARGGAAEFFMEVVEPAGAEESCGEDVE